MFSLLLRALVLVPILYTVESGVSVVEPAKLAASIVEAGGEQSIKIYQTKVFWTHPANSSEIRVVASLGRPDLCAENAPPPSYRGKLVLVDEGFFQNECSQRVNLPYFEEIAQKLRRAGAIGSIEFTSNESSWSPLGFPFYIHSGAKFLDWAASKDGHGNLWTLGGSHAVPSAALLQHMRDLNVSDCTLDIKLDANPWDEMYSSAGYKLTFRAATPSLFCTIAAIACWYLYEHICARKKRKRRIAKRQGGNAVVAISHRCSLFSLAETILIIEIIVMGVLGIMGYVDGHYDTAVLDVFVKAAKVNMFQGVALGNGLLLTLLWFDHRANIFKSKHSSFLERHRRKLIFLVIASFGAQMIEVVLIVSQQNNGFAILVIGGLYTLGQASTAFVYFRETRRFLVLINSTMTESTSDAISASRKEMQLRMLKWLSRTAIAMVLLCLIIISIGILKTIKPVRTIPGWWATWLMAQLVRGAVSFSMVNSARCHPRQLDAVRVGAGSRRRPCGRRQKRASARNTAPSTGVDSGNSSLAASRGNTANSEMSSVHTSKASGTSAISSVTTCMASSSSNAVPSSANPSVTTATSDASSVTVA